jgi:polyisoprenoid-binding protein YceI
MATSAVTRIPVGTWTAEPVHSSLGFSARHMVVATYRGSLPGFTAVLSVTEDGISLTGEGDATTIVTDDDNLTAHLATPDFLDTTRHPTVRFASTSVEVHGGDIRVAGDLTMRGATRPVVFTGTIAGPVADPYGLTRLGLDLTAAIDRTEWGISWNAPMPGGDLVLGTTVTLTANLELILQGD